MSDSNRVNVELVSRYRDRFEQLLRERGEAYLLDTAALTAAWWQLAGSSGFHRNGNAVVFVPEEEHYQPPEAS